MAESLKNTRSNDITPLQQIISSCSGAMITSLFVTPFDVVKVRLQTQQKELLKNRCFLYCNGIVGDLKCAFHADGNSCVPPSYWCSSVERQFTGTVDAFIKITRTEGIRSLWSGLPSSLIMAVPSTVVFFTTYDQLRAKLTNACGVVYPPLWIPVVAGSSARAIAAALISPLELVRTKMQSKKLTYGEISTAVKTLVQSHGLIAMWRGLGPTFMRDIPFSALYWVNYELFKRHFKQDTPTFWFSFVAGATSGTIAALLTLPFDVIKTHRQIELGEMEALSRQSATSTYALMKMLYQRSGYKALFAGIVPRIIKVAPACAIMISTYEYGKKFFHNYNSAASSL